MWAFSTTAEDVRIRNALYDQIGAANTRTLLAKLYPTGSAAKEIEKRLATFKDANATEMELITKEQTNSLIEQLINEILSIYRKSNPV